MNYCFLDAGAIITLGSDYVKGQPSSQHYHTMMIDALVDTDLYYTAAAAASVHALYHETSSVL